MPEAWPALPFEAWRETRATLHMWTQMVGKVRLALAPYVNHWWHTTLYVGVRGLTTGAMPCGDGSFEITFDFVDHVLALRCSDGRSQKIALAPKSVAAFLVEFLAALKALGIDVHIWTMPVEIPNPIAFDKDTVHAAYDAAAVERFWRAMRSIDAVLQEFRGGFIGKASPVHFFWGSFDLTASRFSGRRAPPLPNADAVTREGYSHEECSVGWWPGDEATRFPAFYAYIAPEPAGFAQAAVLPAAAYYDSEALQFRLKYDDVRTAAEPRQALLDFCRSTYAAAADLARWNRAELER